MLYTYRLKSRIGRWYEQLARGGSRNGAASRTPVAPTTTRSRLDAIEAEIKAADLPNWLREQAYLLRAAIDLVRERLGTPEAEAVPRASRSHRATARILERPADWRKVAIWAPARLAHPRIGSDAWH